MSALRRRLRDGGPHHAPHLVLADDAQLTEGAGEGRARLVDRVEEPEEVLAERPLARGHGRAQEADRVARRVVQLLEVVQHEEVRRGRLEEVARQAGLGARDVSHLDSRKQRAELLRFTSKRSRGLPTTSKRRDQRVTSVLRAQPTTTSSA